MPSNRIMSFGWGLLFVVLTILTGNRVGRADSDLRLWYNQPAGQFTQALPLGNGEMGCMVFGGIATERIQFNIDSLLPALPKVWPAGSVKGLCARGGFVVDITWENGALQKVSFSSRLGNDLVVRLGDKVVKTKTETGHTYQYNANLE